MHALDLDTEKAYALIMSVELGSTGLPEMSELQKLLAGKKLPNVSVL